MNIDDYLKGIGDICRYMIVRGWVFFGKKWKILLGYELKILENNYDLFIMIGFYGEDNFKFY